MVAVEKNRKGSDGPSSLRGKEWAESIVSYPVRGVGGDAAYRGNWGASFVEGLLATYYNGGLVVDPMEGSGTSRDVSRQHDVPYEGFDLASGFDAAGDDLLARIARPASLILVHPPYHDMVLYSGAQWGHDADPRDLSRQSSYETFLLRLGLALQNCYRALAPGGIYAVCVADRRIANRTLPITSDVRKFMPGDFIGGVVKAQHRERSAGTPYTGQLVRIKHEMCWFSRKPA